MTFFKELLADVPKGYVAPNQLDHPVTNSQELQRVERLPRRNAFRSDFVPRSTGGTLFGIQVAALSEARACRGLLAPVGCGEGKTLITMLLHLAIDAGGRSVLLIPASMEPQFFSEYERFKKLFALPVIHPYSELSDDTEVCVLKYSILSSPRTFAALIEIAPRLIIADECHRLKNRGAVGTGRFLKYFKDHPETLFCGLSGTITSNSLKDFAHLSKLALRNGSPAPLTWPILTEWSEALDANLPIRRPPGALMSFCGGGETALQGYQRRLTETPGVVASNKNNVRASLVVRRRKIGLPPKVREALENLRLTWTMPDGQEVADALELSRKAREMACGFYYRWDWANEEVDFEWLEARADWHREVRATLHRGSVSGLDSEYLLGLAAERGDWSSVTWRRWAAVRDRKLPPVSPVWIDDFMVKDAVAFGRESPSIIWSKHDAIGAAIASEGGWRLFNGGKKNDRDLLTVTGKETIVCTVQSCSEGKNLPMFDRQLLTSPMSSGKAWEQLLARAHREGQLSDEVTLDLYLHTPESMKAFRKARTEAQWQQELEKAQKRLCMATVIL